MRKFVFLLLLPLAFTAKAQIGYEDVCSEKGLQSNLQYDKSVSGQKAFVAQLFNNII